MSQLILSLIVDPIGVKSGEQYGLETATQGKWNGDKWQRWVETVTAMKTSTKAIVKCWQGHGFPLKKWNNGVWNLGPVLMSMHLGLLSTLDNMLSVIIKNASIWKCWWQWIKKKMHTYRISVDGQKCIKMKTITKNSQVHVLVAWAKSLTYIITCNSIVFKCFSVHGYWQTCQKGSVDMKRSMSFQWQHTFEKALVWSGGPFRPGTCVPTSRGPRKHVSHEMRGKEETLSKLKEAQQDA